MKKKQYIPSNGTEGMMFMAEFCEKCYKYNQCTILTGSLCGKQPKQWIYDENYNPVCTSFSKERPNRKKIDNLPKLF